MSDKISANRWFGDLAAVAKLRQQIAAQLDSIASSLTQAEANPQQTSGQLGLEADIKRLLSEAENLRQGVFKVLVLGDMKRGKSTFLNALLGENLLPSDVSPCTALLTVLRYGVTPKVTIHYHGGKPAEDISFDDFKQRYTISPEEAKHLEQNQTLAFPDISHAVVEHPLPLLSQGIEFVDSPGLNDTEARNQLSLNYIYNSHAILFVLSASQPCTLEERRYLENYLQDEGLNIFFVVNAWDRVRDSLVNPDDGEAVQAAEAKLRQVFHTNLSQYCQANGENIYNQRVFEISALNALRARIKDPNHSLEGTGLPEFLQALNRFLTQERAMAEIERIQTIAQQACTHFSQAVERRIPLLDSNVEELQQKIQAVESDFAQLADINQQFQAEIREIRDTKAQEIADSFKTYILNLESNFESDFLASAPELDYMQFLDKNNRASFYNSFKRAFERYMNDRLAAWEFISKQELAKSFTHLEEKAAKYNAAYSQVLEAINCKLLGYRFYAVGHKYKPNQAATWSDTVMDIFGAIPDNMNRGIYSFNLFWRQVFMIVAATVILNFVGVLFAGLTLSFFGGIAAAAGLMALQAEYVRQMFINATKQEFAKYLPQIASEQWQTVFDAVKQCFDDYATQVSDRIHADISSRQAELDNLLQQKQSHEIDIQIESKRLQDLQAQMDKQLEQISILHASMSDKKSV